MNNAFKKASLNTIVAKDVGKAFGDIRHSKEVVKGCTLDIESRKLTAMIGPSGCGKTTLIRLIAGFEKPTEGTITMDGKPVVGPGRDRLVVFQETALFPWMSVYDNIMYGPRARGDDTHSTRQLAETLLDRVGLRPFLDRYPTQLSGGMQRRAELARAMINNPSIMILDEPFRGLDAMTKELMWEYYSTHYEESRITSLFVTTDIDEALFLADRLLVMTNIPTRVRHVFDIDVPRPRRLAELVENDKINEIKMQVLTLLHDEAMKSFARGSKAAADFMEAYSKRTAQP
jgi:NitT/TauT family transport system ATP-binding protein